MRQKYLVCLVCSGSNTQVSVAENAVNQKKIGVGGWPAYVVGATKATVGTLARRDGTLL